MADFYVFSTMTQDVAYPLITRVDTDLPNIEKTVVIKGGANLINNRLETPRGVCTELSAEDMAICEMSPVFQAQKKDGFIHVEKGSVSVDKGIENLQSADESAPLTPADYMADSEVVGASLTTIRKKDRR